MTIKEKSFIYLVTEEGSGCWGKDTKIVFASTSKLEADYYLYTRNEKTINEPYYIRKYYKVIKKEIITNLNKDSKSYSKFLKKKEVEINKELNEKQDCIVQDAYEIAELKQTLLKITNN